MVIAEMKVTTGAAIEEDERWEAVLARDATYDGAFVGAVLSTKIYCRPSCPAGRPARERVVFFDTPDLAEAAGFRACLRCDPRGEKPDRARLVKEICEFLDGENEERITLAMLGSRFGVSPHPLQRTFKRAMGVSPHQYAAARRVERLKDGLRDGSDVTGALYDAGYGSSSRLYESAGTTLGMTPAAYRRCGSGMRIRYTIVDSQLGRLLVGATERGVCSVKMGDRDEDLEANLLKEYPAAQIERLSGGEHGELSRWVEALLQHVATGKPSVDLPLDIRVTAFQGRVYQVLRSIANGQTQSYADIAKATGRLCIGAVAILSFIRLRGLPVPWTPSLVAKVSVLALVANIAPFALIAWGEEHIESGTASVLNSTMPIFTAIFATSLLPEERFTTARAGGLVVGFLGVLVLTGDEAFDVTSSSVLGQLAVIAASACYGIGSVFSRTLLRSTDPLGLSALQVAAGAVLSLPILLAVEGRPDYSLSIEAWLCLLALGAGATGVAYVAYLWLIDVD